MDLLLQLDAVAAHHDQRRRPARTTLVFRRARLVRAAIVLVGDLVAVPIGPGASEVLLRPGQLRTAVDVVRDSVAVAIGEERTAAALGRTWDVGAKIVDVWHPVAVAVPRRHGRSDGDRRLRLRLVLDHHRLLAAFLAPRNRLVRGWGGRAQVRIGAPRVALIQGEPGKAQIRLRGGELARSADLGVQVAGTLHLRRDGIGPLAHRRPARAGSRQTACNRRDGTGHRFGTAASSAAVAGRRSDALRPAACAKRRASAASACASA